MHLQGKVWRRRTDLAMSLDKSFLQLEPLRCLIEAALSLQMFNRITCRIWRCSVASKGVGIPHHSAAADEGIPR